MATLLLDALDGLNCFMDRIRGTGDLNQELIDRTLKQIGEFESGDSPATDSSDLQQTEQKSKKEQASEEVSVQEQGTGFQKVKNSLYGMMKRKTKKGIFLI